MKDQLLQRISARSATVGVIGLGYVGLPLALVFEEAGFPVLGFDVDTEKPAALHRGESYIKHIGTERVAAAFARGRIQATSDFARLFVIAAAQFSLETPWTLPVFSTSSQGATKRGGSRIPRSSEPGSPAGKCRTSCRRRSTG